MKIYIKEHATFEMSHAPSPSIPMPWVIPKVEEIFIIPPSLAMGGTHLQWGVAVRSKSTGTSLVLDAAEAASRSIGGVRGIAEYAISWHVGALLPSNKM